MDFIKSCTADNNIFQHGLLVDGENMAAFVSDFLDMECLLVHMEDHHMRHVVDDD